MARTQLGRLKPGLKGQKETPGMNPAFMNKTSV
jgi:hypothetical protein